VLKPLADYTAHGQNLVERGTGILFPAAAVNFPSAKHSERL